MRFLNKSEKLKIKTQEVKDVPKRNQKYKSKGSTK